MFETPLEGVGLILNKGFGGYHKFTIIALEIINPDLQAFEGVLSGGHQNFDHGNARLQGINRSGLGLLVGLSLRAFLLVATGLL